MTFKQLTVLALAMSVSACTLMAQTSGTTMLTADEASAIALEAQPGTIAEAEKDTFEGRTVFDIEVVNAAGDEVEFKIDAETGEILNKWTDDDPTDDPVSGAVEDGDT